VNDVRVGELEAAIADVGALLVRAEKYRRGTDSEGAALRREALALGDAARRLHRHDALDEPTAERMLAAVAALTERIRALLAAIRHDPDYRTAVAAHAAGDQRTLTRLLPAIFDGLDPVAPPPALFRAVTWRHRGRVRPATDVTAEVLRTREEGLVAEGDDPSPGVDPELGAVLFRDTPPADDPVVLRLLASALPVPTYRLADTGDYLAYSPRLRAPFDVLLAADLPAGETDATPFDWPRYRHELTAALGAAGVPVETIRGAGDPQ